jgi:hypothetical protein
MTGRVIHYSETVEFHKALPGAKSVVIWKRDDTPAVARTAKPKNIPNLKRETTMVDYSNDISRGPFYSMIDRQARARQAITGESYAKAFTECYTAPENIAIRDNLQYEHIAKSHDTMFGTGLSSIPTQKAAAPPDPPQDDVSPGPAHDELDRLVMVRMKAEPKLSYQQSFTREYLHPANASLKQRYDSESEVHMRRMAPTKPFPRYTSPGHDGEASNIGYSGAKPRGYAGG